MAAKVFMFRRQLTLNLANNDATMWREFLAELDRQRTQRALSSCGLELILVESAPVTFGRSNSCMEMHKQLLTVANRTICPVVRARDR